MKRSQEIATAFVTVVPTLGFVLCMVLPGVLRSPPRPAPSGPPAQHGQSDQTPPSGRSVRRDELLPVDRSFFDLAAATGGDFYFWSSAEFATADFPMPGGGEPLLLAYGELDGAPRRFEFPVDGVSGRLDLFAGAQRLDGVHIGRPSGVAPDGDPASTTHQTERMRRVEIELPESGAWTVELTGRGLFALSVHVLGRGRGQSSLAPEPIECIDFDFVAPGGRPGHEGLFPLHHAVRPGERVTLEVVLSGAPSTAEMHLVGLDGRRLGPTDGEPLARAGFGDPGDRERFFVSAIVPDVPFRVLVRGLDATGAPYQRVFPNSVDPHAPELEAVALPAADAASDEK